MTTYSVTRLTETIHDLLATDERLRDVWVAGEITSSTRAASGHWYFSIRDANATLRCVMFRSNSERQRYQPENGHLVRVRGNVGVYAARGEYQLYVEEIEREGTSGDRFEAFERLKTRLMEEGLLAPECKRALPFFPRRIAIVTSLEAAALRDVLHVLARRYPQAALIISPTLVQGEAAPAQIVAAIARVHQWGDCEVLLLVRGGGSMEDLWAFNDEGVARAIAASPIPVVAGIGHETDFTIADFVADVRAPTPSAAAEIVSPDRVMWTAQVEALSLAMDSRLAEITAEGDRALLMLRSTLRHLGPDRRLRDLAQGLDERQARLEAALARRMQRQAERLEARAAVLESANPIALLGRGYAIVLRDLDGRAVHTVDEIAPGDRVRIVLADGEAKARVEEKTTHGG
jgi:exodeoxyribonuclease VII large subunit